MIDPATMLRCSRCGEWKADEEFSRSRERRARRERAYECRACRRERRAVYDRQGGACQECGGRTRSRRARLCEVCRPEHAAGVHRDQWIDRHGESWWTRDRIIAAIRRFHRSRGRLPTQDEWNAQGRVRAVEGRASGIRTRYPSGHTVRRVFGTWSEGIAAAGFRPRRDTGSRSLALPPSRAATTRNATRAPDSQTARIPHNGADPASAGRRRGKDRGATA